MRLAQLLWECDEEEENFWENDQEQIFFRNLNRYIVVNSGTP